jgi:hypothetical protein
MLSHNKRRLKAERISSPGKMSFLQIRDLNLQEKDSDEIACFMRYHSFCSLTPSFSSDSICKKDYARLVESPGLLSDFLNGMLTQKRMLQIHCCKDIVNVDNVCVLQLFVFANIRLTCLYLGHKPIY